MNMAFLDGKIVLNTEEGGGNITSGIERDRCPDCSHAECNDCWCGSGDEEPEEDAEEAASRLMYNGAIDGIESLLLALACAGCITKSEDPKVNEAIQTALDACGHHFS